MNFHYSGEITLGSLINGFVAILAAFAAWKDMSYRVKSLEQWRTESLATANVAAAAVVEIKEAVVLLKAIAAGQERRIIMLEERK